MTHKMKLVDFAFKAIKNGEKDIELRLNDEKRRLVNVGDTIIFTNIDTKEELCLIEGIGEKTADNIITSIHGDKKWWKTYKTN